MQLQAQSCDTKDGQQKVGRTRIRYPVVGQSSKEDSEEDVGESLSPRDGDKEDDNESAGESPSPRDDSASAGDSLSPRDDDKGLVHGAIGNITIFRPQLGLFQAYSFCVIQLDLLRAQLRVVYIELFGGTTTNANLFKPAERTQIASVFPGAWSHFDHLLRRYRVVGTVVRRQERSWCRLGCD